MAVKPDPQLFGQVKNYVKILKTYRVNTDIKSGNFYSFIYKVDKSRDYNVIKFYDLMPLIFFFDVHPKHKNIIYGLNFHHLPLRARNLFLLRMKELMAENWDANKRLVRIAKFERLFIMFKKASKFAVRQYDLRNMRQIREIPNKDMENISQYYSKTHYGININNVEKNYLAYRWNS